MRAYKFLRTGAVGPFSLVAWPLPDTGGPGAWVDGAGPPSRCATGVHACHAGDLPHWLSDELWEVELRGAVSEQTPKLVAASGRLLARVTRWDAGAAAAYAQACAARAAELAHGAPSASGLPAYAADAARYAADAKADPDRGPVNAATAAFVAASAAGRAGGGAAAAAERAWQARWLIAYLRLEPADP